MAGRRVLWGLAATVLLACGVALTPAGAAPAQAIALPPPHLTAIHPGAPQLRVTPIRVNVVLIGYQSGAVDTNRLVSLLPVEGVPLLRIPLFRGNFFAAGNDQQYHYTIRDAGHAVDDAFFAYLAHTGTVGAPDAYQSFYNGQAHHSVTIGPTVRFVDAQNTERWLEANATARLGINPADFTVFLINWYGRQDFQFHTYTNRSNPDPDTGADPRVTLTQTHVRAWGGSTGPTWFFDLSAGPTWADGSWDVDHAKITTTSFPVDYRLPPIWDYGHTGYRPFDDLTGDLASTVRYAAIDDMFAAAPLFDPAATLSLPHTGKTIALDLFEGDPGRSGRADVHPDLIRIAHQLLEPYIPISVSVRDLPLTGAARTAYDTATLLSVTPGCWNSIGTPIAEFVCYFLGNYPQYFPTATRDAVVPAVGFTTADNPSGRLGFVGNTDDDFATGAPTLVEEFDGPPARSSPTAIAYTHLTIHEAGHFMGLSHPHDGQDPEQFIDYGPNGPFFVAWAGDESASIMSYLPGNSTFDVFDVDNLARAYYARLSIIADFDAGDVLARPPNALAYALLLQADALYRAADSAVRTEHWLNAAVDALAGYRAIQRAMQTVGLLPAGQPATTSARAAATATAAAEQLPQYQVSISRPAVIGTPGQSCEILDRCPAVLPGAGR